ncbi:MAG: hypothetical protein ACYCT0_06300 [Sulfobacillus sp.]
MNNKLMAAAKRLVWTNTGDAESTMVLAVPSRVYGWPENRSFEGVCAR